MNSRIVYAPVLLTTLCRYDSFVRCLNSLRANGWARFTEVFIAVDYPKKEQQKYGHEKILQYLNKTHFSEFKNLTIINRKSNYGAIRNFEKLTEYCFKKFDRCICIFDDLELSPNFIEYMDRVLNKYASDPTIVGVSGYSYPVKWEKEAGSNMFKQNFVASIWGIGFWKDKYKNMHHTIHRGGLVSAYNRMYEAGFSKMTDWAIKDYVLNLCHGVSRKSFLTSITDISMRIYLAVEDKYMIIPAASKIRNHGFDGSGEFCEKIVTSADSFVSGNYPFGEQPIDTEDRFIPQMDCSFDIGENRLLLNKFDYVSPEIMKEVRSEASIYYNRSPFNRVLLNVNHYFYRIRRYLKRKLSTGYEGQGVPDK